MTQKPEEYPDREPYFAASFLRSLFQSRAANIVGPEGIALLSSIVMAEHKRRYASPPTMFLRELSLLTGISRDRIEKVLSIVTRSGWLHTEQQNASTFLCWVTIPD